MTYTTTSAYRTLVAQAIMGTTVDLLPVTLQLGTGHYDPATGVLTPPTPGETALEAPVITDVAVATTRDGQVIRCIATVEGGATTVNVTEAGLFTFAGVMVLIDVFRPRSLIAGVTFQLRYTLLPEVEQVGG